MNFKCSFYPPDELVRIRRCLPKLVFGIAQTRG